jgi:hypothetical protein
MPSTTMRNWSPFSAMLLFCALTMVVAGLTVRTVQSVFQPPVSEKSLVSRSPAGLKVKPGSV